MHVSQRPPRTSTTAVAHWAGKTKSSSPRGYIQLVHAPRAPQFNFVIWSFATISHLGHPGQSKSSASLRPTWKRHECSSLLRPKPYSLWGMFRLALLPTSAANVRTRVRLGIPGLTPSITKASRFAKVGRNIWGQRADVAAQGAHTRVRDAEAKSIGPRPVQRGTNSSNRSCGSIPQHFRSWTRLPGKTVQDHQRRWYKHGARPCGRSSLLERLLLDAWPEAGRVRFGALTPPCGIFPNTADKRFEWEGEGTGQGLEELRVLFRRTRAGEGGAPQVRARSRKGAPEWLHLKLAFILKTKTDGSKRARIIVDLRRFGACQQQGLGTAEQRGSSIASVRALGWLGTEGHEAAVSTRSVSTSSKTGRRNF